MKFFCDRCSTKYSIADEKVRGKVVKVRCKVIEVRGTELDGADGGAGSEDDLGGENREWYYSVEGQTFGPLPEDELRDKYRQGELGENSYVWADGFEDWKSATEVDVFAAALGGGGRRPPETPPAAGSTEGRSSGGGRDTGRSGGRGDSRRDAGGGETTANRDRERSRADRGGESGAAAGTGETSRSSGGDESSRSDRLDRLRNKLKSDFTDEGGRERRADEQSTEGEGAVGGEVASEPGGEEVEQEAEPTVDVDPDEHDPLAREEQDGELAETVDRDRSSLEALVEESTPEADQEGGAVDGGEQGGGVEERDETDREETVGDQLAPEDAETVDRALAPDEIAGEGADDGEDSLGAGLGRDGEDVRSELESVEGDADAEASDAVGGASAGETRPPEADASPTEDLDRSEVLGGDPFGGAIGGGESASTGASGAPEPEEREMPESVEPEPTVEDEIGGEGPLFPETGAGGTGGEAPPEADDEGSDVALPTAPTLGDEDDASRSFREDLSKSLLIQLEKIEKEGRSKKIMIAVGGVLAIALVVGTWYTFFGFGESAPVINLQPEKGRTKIDSEDPKFHTYTNEQLKKRYGEIEQLSPQVVRNVKSDRGAGKNPGSSAEPSGSTETGSAGGGNERTVAEIAEGATQSGSSLDQALAEAEKTEDEGGSDEMKRKQPEGQGETMNVAEPTGKSPGEKTDPMMKAWGALESGGPSVQRPNDSLQKAKEKEEKSRSTLTAEEIMNGDGIKQVRKSVGVCRQRHKRTGAPLEAGKVYLTLQIQPDGRVSSFSISPKKVANTAFERCLGTHKTRWMFQSFSGGPKKIKAPFIIR
ncbi:MAG: GYF domain-containing protein [Bradymonadaceae bacterium]